MKVLVVDNDELTSRILSKKLDNWGHTATTARNSFEAERLIERESYRLVITEIDLPGRSGIEFVRFIRNMNRPRYIYIMIFTGVTDSTELLEAMESGADDLLRKPLNVIEMRQRIRNAKRMLNLEDELREGAGIDGTTGLVNLQSFRQFLRVIVANDSRTLATSVLMFIRVDNYIAIRESGGYKAAEHTVRTVSKALIESVRAADLISRTGDDVFCVCLQNTDWPTCKRVGEKAIDRVKGTQLVFEGHDLQAQITIELVNFPDPKFGADELLEIAPRSPFLGGDPVTPRAVSPTITAPDRAVWPDRAAPTADEAELTGSPEIEPVTAELLRRAGIDPAAYRRLSDFEQRQVMRLAEQLSEASADN